MIIFIKYKMYINFYLFDLILTYTINFFFLIFLIDQNLINLSLHFGTININYYYHYRYHYLRIVVVFE